MLPDIGNDLNRKFFANRGCGLIKYDNLFLTGQGVGYA